MKYFEELFISITVDKGTIILCQPFLSVPDIRFDVYLGQTFISSKDFYMYHPKFVLFTFPQKQEIMFEKDNVLLDSHDTLRASLRYLSKDTYKEATERAKNQNNYIKNFTLRNQTSTRFTSDAHPTKFYSTFDRHSDAKIQNISALHNIQNVNSEENYYGISNSNIDREFQKEMNRFNIEPDAQEELWNSYQRYGKAPIPISNLVEESGKVDTFHEVSESFYKNVDELIALLNLSHLPVNEQTKLKNFLSENMDVFSRHDLDIGTVKDYEAKITLKNEVKNFEMKHVAIPKNLRGRVGQMLNRYAERDIIEEVKENVLDPLISNLLPLKKGVDKIRLVLDLRPVNHFTRKTKSSHTSLFDTLYSVDLNASHYSTIDLSSSYYSIKLHPSCYGYFCFYFGNKLYNLKRTAMGHSESHNHLARVLNKIFPDKTNLRIYLDDLIITHHGTIAEAVQDVMGVLQKLKLAGLKVSPKKHS